MMMRAFLARIIHPLLVLVLMHRTFVMVLLATFEVRGRQHAPRNLLLAHVFAAA